MLSSKVVCTKRYRRGPTLRRPCRARFAAGAAPAGHPRRRCVATVRLQEVTGSGRYFSGVVNRVSGDLGGKRELSEVQNQLVQAFAGTATLLQVKNFELMLGERVDEVDAVAYATLVSCLTHATGDSGLGLHRPGFRVSSAFSPDARRRLYAQRDAEYEGEWRTKPLSTPGSAEPRRQDNSTLDVTRRIIASARRIVAL
jgi:hypothetical protein